MIELNPVIVVLISFGILLLLFATGMWIFIAIGITALICAVVFQGSLGILAFVPYSSTRSFILTAIVAFVFMGEIMFRSGTSKLLFQGSSTILRSLPGGLLQGVILASGIFAASSGSSVGACATIGRIAFPELRTRGYNKRISLGAVTGGSTLANFIPPSFSLILYGAIVQESVPRLFIAGLVPGVIMMLMMMVYIAIMIKIHPQYAPSTSSSFDLKETRKAIVSLLPIIGIIVIVLGSIYTGWATPTEAGALGGFCAILLAASYRRLSWKMVSESAIGSVTIGSMALILLVTAAMLASVYAAVNLSGTLANFIASAAISKLTVIAGIIILYLFLGLFMETIAVIILTIGIIYPIMMGFGADGIWLGIIICILAQIGLITPPVGVLLYVTQAVYPGTSLLEVSLSCLPYVFILMIMVILLIIWPEIALWLPTLLMG